LAAVARRGLSGRREMSERFADGLAKKSELKRALLAAAEVAQALNPDGEPTERDNPGAPAFFVGGAGGDVDLLGQLHDVVEMSLRSSSTLRVGNPGLDEACQGKGRLREPQARMCNLLPRHFWEPLPETSAIDPAWLAWNDGTIAQLARRLRTTHLRPAADPGGCPRRSRLQ